MKPIALCILLSISIRLREKDPMRCIKNIYFPPEEGSVSLTQPIVYKFPPCPARPAHKIGPKYSFAWIIAKIQTTDYTRTVNMNTYERI